MAFLCILLGVCKFFLAIAIMNLPNRVHDKKQNECSISFPDFLL